MKMITTALFNEASLRYIQQTLHASRKEIIKTIRYARISADAIAACLRRQRKGYKPEQKLFY